MKSRILTAMAMALTLSVGGLLVGGAIAADDKKPGEEVKCPVSNKAVNPDATVEFEEATVYFCCNNCPKAFAKDEDHAKFGPKARMQMVQTDQLKQTACPFTGGKLNPETAVKVGAVEVAFCCKNCKGKVEKVEGDERVNLVFKDTSKGFKLAKDMEDK